MSYRWSPSKSAKREFAKKMEEIEEYCDEHGIESSASNDSYYFRIGNERYRVSNHTIAASNRGAYDRFGNQIREMYHTEGEYDREHDITASKTRIIEIHQALLAGKKLDKRGRVIDDK